MIRSDNLIPLLGGAYSARSTIADAEFCENLFPENNPETSESPTPVTHYPREGKTLLSQCPTPAPGRGIFTLSKGQLLAVAGPNLFYIDQDWAWHLLGGIGNLLTPVSISDNGNTAVIVDGSANGWEVTIPGLAFSPLNDPSATFSGSIRTDFSDTFLAFAKPGTNEWYLSDSGAVTFNALVTANKDSTPDPISTLAFNIRQMWLIGTRNSEIWYLAGSTPFPYQSWPNVFVPYGCIAPYSLVRADIDLFWLSNNEQGAPLAVKTKGYGVEAISTRALEYEWSTYNTVADCIGSTFQQAGHIFIIFNFPIAGKTWAYDLLTKQWHRRSYTDANGVQQRDLTTFHANVGPAGGYRQTVVGQDYINGHIYALDPKVYADNGQPIVHRRSFPHQLKDMHEITHVSFVADFETGGIANTSEVLGAASGWGNSFMNAFGQLSPQKWQVPLGPVLCMRYSNDGGNKWSNYRAKGLVTSGNYRSMMRWRGLGMARDRVYEVMWSYPGPSALQGGYLDPLEHSA